MSLIALHESLVAEDTGARPGRYPAPVLPLETALRIAGAAQLALAIASLAIPRALGWRAETRRLEPLTREVFWTYAAYIWGTNVALGLVSLLAAEELAGDGVLAGAVAGYALVYWGARLAIQFLSFGKHAPQGARYRIAEAALAVLFVYLTAVYGWALWS